ncbi:hypothetical protein TOK_4228 [Pseudonocardia sp. N23]|nr:hypothetical protein TOK_4228 [Pseudonocardia sp. N23]
MWEPAYSGTAVTTGGWQTWSPSTVKGWWASRDVRRRGDRAPGRDHRPDRHQPGQRRPRTAGPRRPLRPRRHGLRLRHPVVPTTIVATAGDEQTAQTGKPFATALATKVTGAGNLAAPGRTVTGTVATGSASFGGQETATATTGADGVATAPTLTAGQGRHQGHGPAARPGSRSVHPGDRPDVAEQRRHEDRYGAAVTGSRRSA